MSDAALDIVETLPVRGGATGSDAELFGQRIAIKVYPAAGFHAGVKGVGQAQGLQALLNTDNRRRRVAGDGVQNIANQWAVPKTVTRRHLLRMVGRHRVVIGISVNRLPSFNQVERLTTNLGQSALANQMQ